MKVRFPLRVLLALILALGLLALAASSAAADFTWTGAAGAADWSNTTNWGGSAPSGAAGILTFPALVSPACTSDPVTATCYESHNDVSGVSATSLSIDDGAGYIIDGNAITLGAGGLTASTATSGFNASLGLPITLGAGQTWSIDGNGNRSGVDLDANVTGASSALGVQLGNRGQLQIDNTTDVEVGDVAITGSDAGNTGFAANQNGIVDLGIGGGPGMLNASSGHTVSITDAMLLVSAGTVGALAATGSDIQVGGGFAPAGTLNVAGAVTLDPGSVLSMEIDQAGTTAGTDYSQLSATDTVALGAATLGLFGPEPGGCPSPLHPGDVDTIITTTGSLTGAFPGTPEGTVVPIDCERGARIHYTANSVTATIVALPPSNNTPPTVSGQATQGRALNVAHGSWTSNASFHEQWMRCNTAGGNCSPIAGATGLSYLLGAADVGSRIRVREAAGNTAGFGTPVFSAATGTVRSSGGGTTPPPAGLPKPVAGKSVNLEPVSGKVTYKCKGGRKHRLEEAKHLPVGCLVDARKGKVRLIAAANRSGSKTKSAIFYDGQFTVHEKRSAKPVTEVRLAGKLSCTSAKSQRAVSESRRRRRHGRGRRLWGKGKGRFRTRGRHSSATVRGTTWLVQDRCDGTTLTKVRKGRVTVRDFRRHKTVIVKKGHTYVAR